MENDAEHLITGDDLERMRAYVNAFPLPPHMTPCYGAPLAAVDDEALLNCPPQLIAHVQRTASQGGYQTISPRQTPFSNLMVRKDPTTFRIGDHEVGSVADRNASWPTLDDRDFTRLLPDAPLPPANAEVSVRAKTKTTSLIKGHDLLKDPVLACLIKGRAVIDILRRDDVVGGGDELAVLLAAAWGVDVEDIMELDAYSLGLEGDLQRHAMKADEVYPMVYAPCHVRDSVSMGVSDLDKSVVPAHHAMDWRRMRVFCEAIFINSCAIEGLPISRMRSGAPPGTTGLAKTRTNMMVFAPAPGVAWSYAPETFSVVPIVGDVLRRVRAIPPEVRLALQSYVKVVRPISHMLSQGKTVGTWRSVAIEVNQATGETLADNYARVSRSMNTGRFRGRGAHKTVRNAIFEIISDAPLPTRTRIVRYLKLAREECATHLDLLRVPESVIHHLAQVFCRLGVTMREKLVSEAARRGHTIEEWWHDILTQAPDSYMLLEEGTFGWVKVALWMAFTEPTNKWYGLKHAANMTALSEAACNSVGAVALPAEKGSVDRLLAATRAAKSAIAESFAGYYQGVADVGHAIAREAQDMGKERTANACKEAAILWTLRARCLRAVNVSPIAHNEPTPSKNHTRITAKPVDLLVKPAPYMPFAAWKVHVLCKSTFSREVKNLIQRGDKETGTETELIKKSMMFGKINRPLMVAKESTLTRYLLNPGRLEVDLEKGWKLLSDDLAKVAKKVCNEVPDQPVVHTVQMVRGVDIGSVVAGPSNQRARTDAVGPTGLPLRDFWEVYGEEGDDIALGIEDKIDSLPEEYQVLMYEGNFENVRHIMYTLRDYNAQIEVAKNAAAETVS